MLDSPVDGIKRFFVDRAISVRSEGNGVLITGKELSVESLAMEAADSAGVPGIAIVVEFPEILPQILLEAGNLRGDAAVNFGDFARRVDGKSGTRGLVGAVDADKKQDALPAKRIAAFDVLVLEFDDLRVEVRFIAVDGELFSRQSGAVAGVFDEEEGGFHLAGDGFLVGDDNPRDAAVGFQSGANLLKLLILLLELFDLPLGRVVDVVKEQPGRSADHQQGEEQCFCECAP